MKISYDTVSSDYVFPLSKKDISEIKKYLPEKVIEKIRRIRFGCNMRTTQEGRLVKAGDVFDIRINFCLKYMESSVLSERATYLEQVRRFGGVLNRQSRSFCWRLEDAKNYATFLVLHEMAHIVYFFEFIDPGSMGKGADPEEQWCDKYSMEVLKSMGKSFS